MWSSMTRPQMASQSATALSQTLSSLGTGIGSIGTGIGGAFSSIGSGSAKLLDPLFTLKDLFDIGDDPVASSRSVDVRRREQEVTITGTPTENQELTASNTLILDPVVNTASDQPNVTPQSPASETAVPQSSRVATQSERATLSSLTGGLLG